MFAGNMWGKCDNGTEGLGCGRPETFRNCADIQIVTSTSGLPPQFIHNRPLQYHYSSALRGDDLRIAPQIYYPLVVKYVARAYRRRSTADTHSVPGFFSRADTLVLFLTPTIPPSTLTRTQFNKNGRYKTNPVRVDADRFSVIFVIPYGHS